MQSENQFNQQKSYVGEKQPVLAGGVSMIIMNDFVNEGTLLQVCFLGVAPIHCSG